MRQRTLGSATVTAIGFGDLRLATATARGLDARDVERAVHAALSLGITLIDVADEAAAEQLAGDAVRALRLRDGVVIATRVPAVAARAAEARRDLLVEQLPARHVQDRVEASLRASRLEALPLVQLPLPAAWQSSPAWPELAGTCARLVREGKVVQWGAIAERADEAEPAGERAADAGARERSDREVIERAVDASGRDRSDRGVIGRSIVSIADALADGGLPADVLGSLPAEVVAAALAANAPNAAPAPGTGAPDASDGAAAAPRGLAGVPWLAAIAVPYSLCDRSAAPSWLRDRDAAPPARSPAVLARSPLAGGALAGLIGPGMKLALHDDRRAIDAATLERIAVALARLAPLVHHEPAAARSCDAARAALEHARRPDDDAEAATAGELALRYAIDRGAIALPRLHRHDHVAAAIAAAAAAPLSGELHARLDELFS